MSIWPSLLARWAAAEPAGKVIEPNLRAGTRLQVTAAVDARCVVEADDPVEPPRRCRLPPGLILLTDLDSVSHASAFLCYPEDYAAWEPELVRGADRFGAGYRGYRLLLPKQAVGDSLRILPS